MTLPPGFGERNQSRKETPKKCGCTFIQKSIVGREYGPGNGCHSGYSSHDFRKALVLSGMAALVIITLIMLISIHQDLTYSSSAHIRNNIEGFSCDQLAEYVADKSPKYYYAEHRYEWLCVNEQIKEFQ